MNCNEIFLEDLLSEIIEDESKVTRYNMYFMRWIRNNPSLQEFTDTVWCIDGNETLITDKEKFLREFKKLIDTKQIIFRHCTAKL